MHYTGRPGFCSSELWHHRAFVKARGGHCEVSMSILNELHRLEALHDPNYVLVKWEHPVEGGQPTSIHRSVVGGPFEVHALSVWPRDIPEAKIWIGLCRKPDVNVRVLRDYILDERVSNGIVFSVTENRWHMTGDYAAASATDKEKALNRGRRILQAWAARSINDWARWYNSRITGTDDGGVGQVSLPGGGGKFSLFLCVACLIPSL